MTSSKPKTTYLKDYAVPDFLVEKVSMHFDLNETATKVTTLMNLKRNPKAKNPKATLRLNGEELELQRVLLNSKPLAATEYEVDAQSLSIAQVPDQFSLETEVKINPQANTKLSGLYKTSGNYCTQCESEGFRRITYFLDRPDILTKFTTTISADKNLYPILLSNGNLVAEKQLANNRHWVKWEDPSLKPCALFALVAGDLGYIQDTFTTMNGRPVDLFVYVEKDKTPQADYAMQALKRAMLWDEKTFGREYDLNRYMLVAVSDFNFGAMENKGLNIFNDKYILAKPDIATDADYIAIESVIGHEYFHNWSGNRVACRDWFQISLKEGLTMFRDQSFTADLHSKTVKRIQDVRTIRSAQFAQDASPMAHPVRPDSYIEVSNFYTVTVYHKGAELIRMLQTILGQEQFRNAMDLYFSRHDGQAVTTDDFIQAMEDNANLDLSQFRYWYQQAGTPVVDIEANYDADKKHYTLRIKQSCPPTPQQPSKQPFHIPLAVALFDQHGNELPLQLTDETKPSDSPRILNIKTTEANFTFTNLPSAPIPSLLRNFSAPVKLHYAYSEADLIFLMTHDSDAFSRWNAGQELAANIMLRLINAYDKKKTLTVPENFIAAYRKLLTNTKLNKQLAAEMLCLPTEASLYELLDEVDVVAVHEVRQQVQQQLARALSADFLLVYQNNHISGEYKITAEAMGKRSLKNICLAYLMQTNDAQIRQMCLLQFNDADNMTDIMGALTALNDSKCAEREQTLAAFYQRFGQESLLVDKWFALQARSTLDDTLATVKSLLKHKDFNIKNPNRVRSLLGTFCSANHIRFHDITGAGYKLLTDYILKLNTINPQVAARIIEPMISWRKFDAQRQKLMTAQLKRITKAPKLSKELYEIVQKSLNQ